MTSSQILDRNFSSVCSYCKKLSSIEVSCTNCGFPQNGTTEQKKSFHKKVNANRSKLEKLKRRIYLIVGILVLIAGFNGFFGVVMIVNGNFIGLFSLIVGGIFGGFAYWSLKKPFPAFMTALIFFILNTLGGAIMNPQEFFQFSILHFFQILILGGLINGIYSSKMIQKIEREFVKV